jgi:hypothetical protein
MVETTQCKPARHRQPFAIACQSPEAVEPAEAALDYPAARQQYEAILRLGLSDDLQLNAFVARRLGGGLVRIALVFCPRNNFA